MYILSPTTAPERPGIFELLGFCQHDRESLWPSDLPLITPQQEGETDEEAQHRMAVNHFNARDFYSRSAIPLSTATDPLYIQNSINHANRHTVSFQLPEETDSDTAQLKKVFNSQPFEQTFTHGLFQCVAKSSLEGDTFVVRKTTGEKNEPRVESKTKNFFLKSRIRKLGLKELPSIKYFGHINRKNFEHICENKAEIRSTWKIFEKGLRTLKIIGNNHFKFSNVIKSLPSKKDFFEYFYREKIRYEETYRQLNHLYENSIRTQDNLDVRLYYFKQRKQVAKSLRSTQAIIERINTLYQYLRKTLLELEWTIVLKELGLKIIDKNQPDYCFRFMARQPHLMDSTKIN